MSMIFHYINVRMRNIPNFVSIIGLWFQELNISWDDNSCQVIDKNYHKINYHRDINYHMTLHTMFSVVM